MTHVIDQITHDLGDKRTQSSSATKRKIAYVEDHIADKNLSAVAFNVMTFNLEVLAVSDAGRFG